MMKQFLMTLLLLGTLVVSVTGVMAQDDTGIQPLTLSDVLVLIQTEYAGDPIRELSLDLEDACWKVHLTSGQELCVLLSDGTIIEDDNSLMNSISGTTPSGSDDSFDDNSDDSDDSFDDNPSSSDSSSDDSVDWTQFNVIITPEQAIAEALRVYPNAEVISIELETGYNNNGVWDIELNTGREVDIDVETGVILAFGYSGDDDRVEPISGRSDDDDSDDDDRYDDSDDNDDSDDDLNDDNGDDNDDDSNDDHSSNDSDDDDDYNDDSSNDDDDRYNDDDDDDNADSDDDDDHDDDSSDHSDDDDSDSDDDSSDDDSDDSDDSDDDSDDSDDDSDD